MREDKRPCRKCHTAECAGVECEAWREDFTARWDQTCQDLQAKAWQQVNAGGKNTFHYGLPHEMKDPCKSCMCQVWCKTPCSLRLSWWDNRMSLLRKTLSEIDTSEVR